MPLGSLAPNAHQTAPAACPQRTSRSTHVSYPFSDMGSGCHVSRQVSTRLYNYPFLTLRSNVIKKGKTKNPGAESHQVLVTGR